MNQTTEPAAATEHETAVLIVGDWTTECSACGAYADPAETHHVTVLHGFSGEPVRSGCGARFVGMRPSLSARIMPGVRPCGHVADIRPDLPVVSS